MTAAIIDCDDCGHCMDFKTPYEGQPKALTLVQNDIADTVAKWIADAQKPWNNAEEEVFLQ